MMLRCLRQVQTASHLFDHLSTLVSCSAAESAISAAPVIVQASACIASSRRCIHSSNIVEQRGGQKQGEIIGTVPGTNIKLTRVKVPFWNNTPLYQDDDGEQSAEQPEGQPLLFERPERTPIAILDEDDGFGGLELPSKYGNLLEQETNRPWPEDLWDYLMFRGQTIHVIRDHLAREEDDLATHLSNELKDRDFEAIGRLFALNRGEDAGRLMEEVFPPEEHMPSVAEAMFYSEKAEAKAQRRQRELELQEALKARWVRKVDENGVACATGKRKCSVAMVWLKKAEPEADADGEEEDGAGGMEGESGGGFAAGAYDRSSRDGGDAGRRQYGTASRGGLGLLQDGVEDNDWEEYCYSQPLGSIKINRRPFDEYFVTADRRKDVLEPFIATRTLGKFDVKAVVKGGGVMGQAQALRMGIACALQKYDPAYRPILRAEGLVTRDSRIVERKKPGKPKARKSFQWVKR